MTSRALSGLPPHGTLYYHSQSAIWRQHEYLPFCHCNVNPGRPFRAAGDAMATIAVPSNVQAWPWYDVVIEDDSGIITTGLRRNAVWRLPRRAWWITTVRPTTPVLLGVKCRDEMTSSCRPPLPGGCSAFSTKYGIEGAENTFIFWPYLGGLRRQPPRRAEHRHRRNRAWATRYWRYRIVLHVCYYRGDIVCCLVTRCTARFACLR